MKSAAFICFADLNSKVNQGRISTEHMPPQSLCCSSAAMEPDSIRIMCEMQAATTRHP